MSYQKDNLQTQQNFQEKSDPHNAFPTEYFHMLLNDQLGRDYLGRLGKPEEWKFPDLNNIEELHSVGIELEKKNFRWMHVDRLPVSPSKAEEYDLLSRWQSVLSAAHTMQCSVGLALVHNGGETHLYLGAYKSHQGVAEEEGNEAIRAFSRAARIHMPGISLHEVESVLYNKKDIVQLKLDTMGNIGIVTGLPSNRFKQKDKVNLIQTLDKLAYGLPDPVNGLDMDYMLLVLAEPVDDAQNIKLMNTLLGLQSGIHSCVSQNLSLGLSEFHSKGGNLGIGAIVTALLGAVGGVAGTMVLPGAGTVEGTMMGVELAQEGLNVLGGTGIGISRSQGYSANNSSSYEKKDFIAAYCENLIEKHIERLKSGRSMGFWNTGIYVAGKTEAAVDAVLGMLRSIYSGPESYMEPIRTVRVGKNDFLRRYLMNYSLPPLPGDLKSRIEMGKELGLEKGHWHIFGSLYESFSTPLTTDELSLATSLPRCDVPGLRFVHNAVKLTSNPPLLKEGTRKFHLGKIMDMGIMTGTEYELDADSLVRHVLNDGITGYGKSTTTHTILSGISQYEIPWLVIEPVKTDYVEWAMEYNDHCLDEKDKITVYMPGYEEIYGRKLAQMQFNPFQPCVPEGEKVRLNLQGHLDALSSILMASVTMGDVLPLLMKEALVNYAKDAMGADPDTGNYFADCNQVDPAKIQNGHNGYPMFSGILKTVEAMMRERAYGAESHQNLSAAMTTRIKSLLMGWKKDFFDAPQSTPGRQLFDRKVIINLIGIESDEDKAFFMSLFLRALYEYRSSSYYYIDDYRKQLKDKSKLMHFTIVEEAHRLLAAPKAGYAGEANPQSAAASMFSNMLREMRKWGEGLMIVDQQPSQLIPDAIKNTDLKIIHRMPSEDDRRTVGGCMGLNEEQTDLIAALGIGEAILSSTHDDAAVWVKVDRSMENV